MEPKQRIRILERTDIKLKSKTRLQERRRPKKNKQLPNSMMRQLSTKISGVRAVHCTIDFEVSMVLPDLRAVEARPPKCRTRRGITQGHDGILWMGTSKWSQKRYEKLLRRAYQSRYGNTIGDGAFSLELRCIFARPASETRWSSDEEIFAATPFNTDLLASTVLDALIGVAWIHDGQVAHLKVEKLWSKVGERNRVEIRIRRLGHYGRNWNGGRGNPYRLKEYNNGSTWTW